MAKKIEVLGTGCPTCKEFFNTVKKVAEDLEIETEIKYYDDVAKMVELGVMTGPVLVVEDKAILIGSGHEKKEIREALLKACFSSIEEAKSDNCQTCSGCCGGCD
jgi:small redox-active disulfide protein 2